MILCTYTNKAYKKCLDIMLPTWQKYVDNIIIYSDTDEFGIKMFEPSDDFDESCRRKIKIIKRTLEENKGQNVLYIDTDVMMKGDVSDVFNGDFDVCATRMVHRTDKDGEKDINAGVSFWKANDKTIDFCNKWLELEKKCQSFKYPEQHAFSELCYKGYDELIDVKVSNISERIYNYEHDSITTFMAWLKIYKPKLIHFKTKRWDKKEIVDMVNSML